MKVRLVRIMVRMVRTSQGNQKYVMFETLIMSGLLKRRLNLFETLKFGLLETQKKIFFFFFFFFYIKRVPAKVKKN